MKKIEEKDQFEEKIGIKFVEGKRSFTAFLTNFKTKSFRDRMDNEQKMAVLCYFQSEEGETLKYYLPFSPYFYIGFEPGTEKQVHSYLESKISQIYSIEEVQKIDLQELNHLSGKKKSYLKLNFKTIKDLNNAKNPLKSIIEKKKKKNNDEDFMNFSLQHKNKKQHQADVKDYITQIREYDVPYHSRVCIDTGLRAGLWFDLEVEDKFILQLSPTKQKKPMPDLKILSYDIETSKDPLKFPDVEKDQIMMISLMYEGQAFLIINCQFCGQKVEEFYYDPKPEFNCHVTVYNEQTEKDLLNRFANFMQTYKPTIITSYNGDKFDYPFIKRRCQINYVRFAQEMGVSDKGQQYYGSYISHLDCMYWVDRDAYLPQGSRGLKAVAKSKLNYQPIEVDPQDMVYLAKNHTQRLAEYSVSDAVATYFLYTKHIHGFIYALATIIPMFPDQVLRKGSGTLCQNLLMVEAFLRNIIFPNKKMENFEKFHKGNLLDSQTYTGGKVQCLRTGVYRADFTTDFTLEPEAFQELIENVDQIIKFAIDHEMPEQNFNEIVNYKQIRIDLVQKLMNLKNVKNPSKYETYPLIYHIDVAAMYPNIILTNRLQPVSVVNDKVCSGCLFNDPENKCKRELQWEWRGSVFPLNQGEFLQIKEKMETNKLVEHQSKLEYEVALKKEVKEYCQKIYKKTHIYTNQIKTDTVCMRENSFYVDTVRAFRDRRYQYKHLAKMEQINVDKHVTNKEYFQAKESKALVALYESMQLAHKIILNSYYGYVMRKGARWYSMEMAAMVTYIGSNIISDSKNFIEGRIGKPLQLDTDGIWMLLPKGFPEDVKLQFKSGKTLKLSYPCHILNHLIYQKYANPQYQTMINQENFQFATKKQMTIFFEIDGPYKAMMIPAAKEKQKTTQLDIQEHHTQLLKKRYVVFSFNNKIKQFKGFQMKRRGQLRITKVFQEEIFPQYLKGTTLKQCYAFCAEVAKKYISIIQKKGQGMDVTQILDYLQESRVLSKDVKEYGESKGVAINSAKRLAQFLGPETIRGSKLCCYFVISSHPVNKPISERVIPTQIFDAEMEVQRDFLFRWTKNDILLKGDIDIKNILDWTYYFDRLSTQIQKMVCIPAVLQNISNPVPQIELPQWLQKKTFDMRYHKQRKLTTYNLTNTKITPNKFINTNMKDNASGMKDNYENEPMKSEKKVNFLIEEKKVPISINNKKQQINKFSMKKNFSKWLVEQKRIWKEKKYGQNNPNYQAGNEQQQSKINELKSVLQIIPEKTSGNFNVWYYSNNKIQQLLLTLKRKYYCKGHKGMKKAPREEGDAVEIIIEEEIFKKQEDYYDSLLGQTFYETKLPLITSLIMKKGNIWRMNKQSLVYNQDEISEVFGDYLPNMQHNFMPFVYLVHEKVIDNRNVWALIIPKAMEYTFIFVDKAKTANHDELLLYTRKLLKTKHEAYYNQNSSHTPTKSQQKINILRFNEEKQAATHINKLLTAYQKLIKQSYLVVVQSDDSVLNLQKIGATLLEDQLPVLTISKLKIEKAEILDWKNKSIKSIIEYDATKNIYMLLEWSRYSQIPICNLSTEINLLNYITNIQLGRLLHAGDNLTWWNQYNQELITTYESQFFTGKICNPGLYKTYCIEIQMDNIAINTIANSDDLIIEDRETATLIQKKNPNAKQSSLNNKNVTTTTTQYNDFKIESLDQMSKVKRAFQFIKKMIKLWIKDFQIFQSEHANELLKNFHKWLVTRSNSMYDPLVARMINQLMKKVFYLLMRRLTTLGMVVIYANFSKIILATDKFSLNEAKNSIQYNLKKCVQENQKIFKYISLTPYELTYKCMLFKDQYNYISIFEESSFYYKFEMQKMFHKNMSMSNYFKHILITFIQKLCQIKEDLLIEYHNNKMKLFLEYDHMINSQMKSYLAGQFHDVVLKIVWKLISDWEINKQKLKNKNHLEQLIQEQTYEEYEGVEGVVEGHPQKSAKKQYSDEQEEEENSFIVDEDDVEYQKSHDALDELEMEEQIRQQESNPFESQENQHQKPTTNKRRHKANKKSQKKIEVKSTKKTKKQKEEEDEEKLYLEWNEDNQLDMLVESLFSFLGNNQEYKDELMQIRKNALRQLKLQPSITYRDIKPIYPSFELPCEKCFLVNESPGNCEHCSEPLTSTLELENTVWKMMQEQGRDIYCERCNQIKQDYLKKCNCGGKYVFKEFPLRWIPYAKREGQQWEYVNKVFDFMGIA